MSLVRFRVLCGQYGAHLERWPEGERGVGQNLLHSSAEARSIRDEELRLDRLIARASSDREATFWVGGEQDAALERLCSTMADAMAADTAQGPNGDGIFACLSVFTSKILSAGNDWRHVIWVTAGSSAFGCCGIWIGQFLASAPQADLLSAMQMTLLGGH
ncbi:hypothetical protein KGY14_15240 [Ameyamaea chiangmaiensis]|uniref:Uncharacterized protein n=1 Tax=Ameyamaea chiangmaiensis TaxID=442969 RepID=A0A850PDJ6_9PROT|nr:hypothetical protein [Ameyamaea chiangmaiensis]MBS4076543.1 hypothetical protein [Ameyamaea chiangmaiensis]NVN40012.1 hypothetical protein [Ameyamaea chiangmaiensis]